MAKYLFISQPMNGRTDEEILKERMEMTKQAVEILGEPVEVLDSFFDLESAPVGANALWCLGNSLKLLANADAAFFAPGWENARGCRIERTCAKEYGIRILDWEEEKEDDWLKLRSLKVMMSDKDVDGLCRKAATAGMSAGELVSGMVADLVGGTFTKGSDERRYYMGSWYELRAENEDGGGFVGCITRLGTEKAILEIADQVEKYREELETESDPERREVLEGEIELWQQENEYYYKRYIERTGNAPVELGEEIRKLREWQREKEELEGGV